MAITLNRKELDVLLRALNDHETALGAAWEGVNKTYPQGARAAHLTRELKEVRRIGDMLIAEYRVAND